MYGQKVLLTVTPAARASRCTVVNDVPTQGSPIRMVSKKRGFKLRYWTRLIETTPNGTQFVEIGDQGIASQGRSRILFQRQDLACVGDGVCPQGGSPVPVCRGIRSKIARVCLGYLSSARPATGKFDNVVTLPKSAQLGGAAPCHNIRRNFSSTFRGRVFLQRRQSRSPVTCALSWLGTLMSLPGL